MTLLHDLYAFYLAHRRCGDLDGGVEGERVWMTCTCGAIITGTSTSALPFGGAVESEQDFARAVPDAPNRRGPRAPLREALHCGAGLRFRLQRFHPPIC